MTDRVGLSAHSLLSLIRRNLLLIALGTLLGAVAGFALSTMDRPYSATVVMEVATGADAGQTAMLAESAASTVESPAILSQAASDLGVAFEQLSRSVTADVQAGTNLVDVTAVSDSPQGATDTADAVANVAITDYRTRSNQRAIQVLAAGSDLLAEGTLESARAESARQASIGATVGSTQGQAIQDTATLSVASPALSADRTGVSSPVGILLGAAAGALLTSLLALSEFWNRRRHIRTLADLDYAASCLDATSESPQRASLLAINSGKPTLVVLSEDESAREELARRIAAAVAVDRTPVALVLVVAGNSELQQVGDQSWQVGADRASEVLSVGNRHTLLTRLGARAVVLAAPPSGDISLLLASGDDYLVLLAIPPGTRVWQAREQFEQYPGAKPIGVLLS